VRRKKQLTKRERKLDRDKDLDIIEILALGMQRMLSVPDGFMANDVFLSDGEPGSRRWNISHSREWQMIALAVLVRTGALSFNEDVHNPLCGFTVVKPDLIRGILDDTFNGDLQKIHAIVNSVLNPPLESMTAGEIEKAKEVVGLALSEKERPEVIKPRPLLGVSNQFTEFVVTCMHEAGMPYPVDQHEIVARTGLTGPQLVAVLRDQIGSMDHLYALLRALPKVREYFGRRPAVDEPMRRRWECSSAFAEHREREGITVEQQAALIGMTPEDLERLGRGEFSPSIDEYERIVKIPDFSGWSLMVGVPSFTSAVRAFMVKSKWKHRQLASQARIPSDRLTAILNGSRPNQGEFDRLSILIPSLPRWPDSKASGSSVPEPASHSPEPGPSEPAPAPELPEPTPELPGPAPVPGLTPAAHDHPALTDVERARVQLAEDALLRLSSDGPHRRADLFPGESYDPSPHSWQPAFLQKLHGADVVVRTGERNHTRYRGIKERVDALLGDTDWLLRLVAPAALSRTAPGPSLPVDPDEAESVGGSVHPGQAPGVAEEFLAEAQRLLPDFFRILQYQHDRISSMEAALSAVNLKLDSVLAHLKGDPDDPA